MTCNSCPICATAREAFANTAAVTGRYVCPSGCSGDISVTSEPVVTEIVDITVDKTAVPACLRAGQTVHYTITVCNHSSMPAATVRITDPGIEDLLNVGTIYVNGQPVCDASLQEGVCIPGVGAGCCAALTFDAVIPEGITGLITNTAYAEFQFSSAVCGLMRETAASGEVAISVIAPELQIIKTADRCAVTPEEPTITYTLTVRNTGTCPVESVVVTDVLPVGLTYVPGSTSVNGDDPTNLNPAAGISLGTLESDAVVTIAFQANAQF